MARLVADMETKVFHVYCTRTAEDGELHCVSHDILQAAALTEPLTVYSRKCSRSLT